MRETGMEKRRTTRRCVYTYTYTYTRTSAHSYVRRGRVSESFCRGLPAAQVRVEHIVAVLTLHAQEVMYRLVARDSVEVVFLATQVPGAFEDVQGSGIRAHGSGGAGADAVALTVVQDLVPALDRSSEVQR